MNAHQSPAPALADLAEPLSPLAVLGLRDTWLEAAVRAAVESTGFLLVDVAASTAQLLRTAADRSPLIVVATLDVLGAEPAQAVRRMLVDTPGIAVVVLYELDALPVWLLEAGVRAVVRRDEIGELKRVLRILRER